MAEGLYKRVKAIARTRGISDSDFQRLMVDHRVRYHPIYMDSFATPDDIRVMAEILGVLPSRLFEATSLIGELLGALFAEEWPKHENKIRISKEEASRRVMESEYRWNSTQSTIRNQVELVIKALESPSKREYGCQYPDCDNCITRCAVTGRMIGPED